ncbi:MAG: exodeoxyribonuclease VII small subunit [Actinobacteria bacterium]|nr:MAG: exodeoxyribonuclease VII small subunit [Actinomycetota bacterium]
MSEPSFEDAQRELERIVERLERGESELGDAIRLWERGEELYRFCVSRLDSAQGKIEELARRVESTRP